MTEQIARKLYEQWCRNGGRDGWAPNWDAYEIGASLNGCVGVAGLVADHFRTEAAGILPLDTPEAVARRVCLSNAAQECHGTKGPACTETTCTDWRRWLADARELVALTVQQ